MFKHALLLLIPLLVSMLLVLFAFAVDPLWPAQDATPEMMVQYHADSRFATEIYHWGFAALLLALFWAVAYVAWSCNKKRYLRHLGVLFLCLTGLFSVALQELSQFPESLLLSAYLSFFAALPLALLTTYWHARKSS